MHNIINEHNNRVDLNRKRTTTKTFIGGLVIGIISTRIYFALLPHIDIYIDGFNNYIINLFK